jgi:Chaperonin 10 Kd subunit
VSSFEQSQHTVKQSATYQLHRAFHAAQMPMPCSVGDKVLYGKYDGTAVKYDGKEHQFIRDTDILFVYDGEKMSPDSIKMIRDQILVEVSSAEAASLLSKMLDSLAALCIRHPLWRGSSN